MTIALPFTRLHPETARLAAQHLPGHRRFALDEDPTAYAQLLTRLWADAQDLVIVEHDIGVHASVMSQFDACPQLWCGFVYALPGGVVDAALGCTRFRADLLTAEPDLMTVVSAKADDQPAGHWSHLDAHLRTVLTNRGYTLHRHFPPVAHYHPYPEAS